MFSKKKREEKERRKVLARAREQEAMSRQKDLLKDLVCPCCRGTEFTFGWKGTYHRNIIHTNLFKKKEYDDNILPYVFYMCENCGLELNFVTFDRTPSHYFSDEDIKGADSDV